MFIAAMGLITLGACSIAVANVFAAHLNRLKLQFIRSSVSNARKKSCAAIGMHANTWIGKSNMVVHCLAVSHKHFKWLFISGVSTIFPLARLVDFHYDRGKSNDFMKGLPKDAVVTRQTSKPVTCQAIGNQSHNIQWFSELVATQRTVKSTPTRQP